MFSRSAVFSLFVVGASAFSPSTIQNARSSSALNLKIGESAPDFTLTDQNGKSVTRSKIKKPLVVYFYPADATPGCTVQAQSFNEEVAAIRKEYKADVVGISGQDIESKAAFAEDLGLNFSILADTNDEVRKAFEVPGALLGLLPGRVTYVLDKDGVCIATYDKIADAAGHVEAAKAALEDVKEESPFSFLPF